MARLLILALLWAGLPVHANGLSQHDVVHYSGPVSAGQNQRFFASVADKPVRRLVITSEGGEVEAGIVLGRWVFRQGLDLEVRGYCLSSCANYVFPAARRKIIAPGAVVAWHGNYQHLKATGLWQDDIAVRMRRHGEDAATARGRVRTQMERLVRLERDFFELIGVDNYLCWVGKMPPYNTPDYYFLSREDMAAFGVTQVLTPPGYEHTDVSGLDVAVVYLRLGDAAPGAQGYDGYPSESAGRD